MSGQILTGIFLPSFRQHFQYVHPLSEKVIQLMLKFVDSYNSSLLFPLSEFRDSGELTDVNQAVHQI